MHAHDLYEITTPTPTQGIATQGVATQGIATVVGRQPDGSWQLEHSHTEDRPLSARRAASCLLEPAVGDTVWVVGEPGQEGWVLAVLERSQGSATAITVPGDLSVAATGRLTLAGAEGVDLTSAKGLRLHGDAMEVQARTAHVTLRDLTVLARTVFASLVEVTRVGRVLQLLVDRVTQRSQHSVRAIEGLDSTRAGTVDLRAQGRANIQATHALVNGKDLVKMDGGQIHLG